MHRRGQHSSLWSQRDLAPLQEIRRAPKKKPRKQLFPDAVRPGGRVGECCKKHRDAQIQWHMLGEFNLVVWVGKRADTHMHTKDLDPNRCAPSAHQVKQCCSVKQVVRKRSAHRMSIQQRRRIWLLSHNQRRIRNVQRAIRNTYNLLNWKFIVKHSCHSSIIYSTLGRLRPWLNCSLIPSTHTSNFERIYSFNLFYHTAI